MNSQTKQNKYCLDSPQFLEREAFFKKTLQLDVRSYFLNQNGNVKLDKTKLYKDILSQTLQDYHKAAPELFSEDFQVDAIIRNVKDSDVEENSLYVFNRVKLHEISKARGSSIEDWMQKKFKNFSDNIIELKDEPEIKKVAGVILGTGFVSVTSATLAGMTTTYGAVAPLAPVALEGEFVLAEVMEDACACLCVPGAVAGVVIAAAVIAVILVSIACIDRELSGIIINDTNMDFYIEDIHMQHGELTAILGKKDGVRKIPAKISENMVYVSFYTIEKSFGFYGADCTMRLKTKYPKNAYYYLSANPLGDKSRINFELMNDENLLNAHHYSSEEMHDRLYEAGGLDVTKQFDNLCFDVHLNDAHCEKAYAVLTITEIIEDYADFTKEIPDYHGTLKCVGSDLFQYHAKEECYEILPGGFCCFNTDYENDVSYIFNLKTNNSAGTKAKCYCGRSIDLLIQNTEFYPYTFIALPENENDVEAKNEVESANDATVIELINQSENSSIFLKHIKCEHYDIPIGYADWMKNLNDETALEDVNIPGTHDSASIQKYYNGFGLMSGFYVCHFATITEQLNGGIRLLDIRIKIKKQNDIYCFITCHGSIGGSTRSNEFQSLTSLLDECKDFLKKHPMETLICIFKLDDLEIDEKTELKDALDDLEILLRSYPIRSYQKNLGTMGACRGKIIAFNRFNDKRFGYPISWKENTDGEYVSDLTKSERDFKIFAQDHWQYKLDLSPTQKKFDLVVSTINKKKEGDRTVFFNFGSACYAGCLGVYITENLVSYFGKAKAERPKYLGWILLDFEFNSYSTNVYGSMHAVSLMVASNFDYAGCSSEYKLVHDVYDL